MMSHYVIFDTRTGEIRQVHAVYDGRLRKFVTLEPAEVLSTLLPHPPDQQHLDVLLVDAATAAETYRMRVNPTKRTLETIEEKTRRKQK